MTWKDEYAYRVGDLSHVTQIFASTDSPEPGRSADDWPYPTEHITYLAGAGMAEDVKRRAGSKVDQDAPVVVEEQVISGGYSEYTQENDYPFTIRIGNWSKTFDTLRYLFLWLEGKENKND